MSEVPLKRYGVVRTFMVMTPQKSPTIKSTRKVDIRLPEKGSSDSHGTRPVHQIIAMIKWIRTSKLSIKNSH